MGNKVFDPDQGEGELPRSAGDGIAEAVEGDVEIDFSHLDAPRRLALAALCRAFDLARDGEDWFAMRSELRKVDDGVQAVWYAARVDRAAE